MYNRECFLSGHFGPALSVFGTAARNALASLFLLALFSTIALATIDASLNTSNFLSGQTSEISIDGMITSGGTSTSINGATLMIRFDPAKVTLSGIRSGPSGWAVAASNTTGLSEGWAKVANVNSSGNAGEGQTSSGPILYFTVTPVDSSVDVNDCDTLQLSGSESDLSDQDYYTVTPSDPCNGVYAPSGGPDTIEGGLDGRGMDPMTTIIEGPQPEPPVQQPIVSTSFGGVYGDIIVGTPSGPFSASGSGLWGCAMDNVSAGNALRIVGGLSASRPEDIDFYDRNGDGKLTILDALSILRDPCPAPTRWWQFAFNNAMCSNPPALADIDHDAHSYQEVVFSSDYQNPALYNPDPYRSGNPQQVWIMRDSDGEGNYGILSGWPRPLRDAPNGIALANFAGDRSNQNNPWTVFGVNFQDIYDVSEPPHVPPDTQIFSHLWAWTAGGGPVDVNADTDQDFPNEIAPDLPTGLGTGHSISAPAVFDFNNDGIPEVFYHFQGQLLTGQGSFTGGGLKAYAPYIGTDPTEPTLVLKTGTDPSSPWYVPPTDIMVDNPPVFPNLNPNDDSPTITRDVVVASETGFLYGWDASGNASTGWGPKTRSDQYTFDNVPTPTFTDFYEYIPEGTQGGTVTREAAPLYTPIAAGNVDGQPGEEVIAASGIPGKYWGFVIKRTGATTLLKWPANTLDGAVYCWNANGSLLWRYPDYVQGQRIQTFLPAFTSGVSLGHLNGSNGPVAAVIGNVNGEVYAFNASTGAVMWKFQTHAPIHIAYRQIRTEPLIFDVNGDGFQDVVVGTSDGYVYALKGNTTDLNGEELWHVRTFGGVPDSVWPDAQGRAVRESHYEEVRGLGVGNLRGNDRTSATVVVCSSALQEGPGSPLTGHVLILDLGPGTWNPNANSTTADWPQWQRTAQRTGTLSIP